MKSKQLQLFEMPEISTPNSLIAGVDEVGRGALFGCVVASAVVIRKKDIPNLINLGVTDSKKLSAKRRQELFNQIKETVLSWKIAQSTVNLPILQQTMIKGDLRSPVIAAASILAKVWRDNLIVKLAEKYPEYDLIANKGYGTKKHLLAIQKYGITEEHRISFSPCFVKSGGFVDI